MNIHDIMRQMVYMDASLVTGCPKDEYGYYPPTCSTCPVRVRCNMETITIDMMFRGEL